MPLKLNFILHTTNLLFAMSVGKWEAMLLMSAQVLLFISGLIRKQWHRNWMKSLSTGTSNLSTNSHKNNATVTVSFVVASFSAIGWTRTSRMACNKKKLYNFNNLLNKEKKLPIAVLAVIRSETKIHTSTPATTWHMQRCTVGAEIKVTSDESPQLLKVDSFTMLCRNCHLYTVVVWLEILVMLRAQPCSPPSLWTSASAVPVQLASSLDVCSVLYLCIKIKVAYNSNSLCYLWYTIHHIITLHTLFEQNILIVS